MADRDQFDTLAPEIRVSIDEQEIPGAMQADLIAISVVDDVEAASMCEITLANWNGVGMEVTWSDDDLLEVGNAVTIEMGYRDHLASVFSGEITGLEPQFLADAPPVLTVRGHGRGHRLMRRRRTRTYVDMKDSDIAEQIAGATGLAAQVDDTAVVHPYVLQFNETDLAFLQRRARRLGREVFVRDRELHFRRRATDGEPVLTLRREDELLEFFPRVTTLGQVEALRVSGWDPGEKQEIEGTSGAGDETTTMGGATSGPAAVRRAFGDTMGVCVDEPLHAQPEADAMALGWLNEMALRYVTACGTCIGRPDLRAGQLVGVEGIGRRFSGSYYVTKTEHTLRPDTGYRTRFNARRNAT